MAHSIPATHVIVPSSALAPVRVISTANVDISTALANGQTLNGVTLATGQRVLLKDQSTASQNGIYVVPASGAASRSSDMPAGMAVAGRLVPVQDGGTTDDNTLWQCTSTPGSDVVGTSSLTFANVAAAASGDHGSLTGLGDDDHSIYSLADGTRWTTTQTADRAVMTDGSGNLVVSPVTATQLGYLDATSSIQTQLDAKASTSYVDTAVAGLYDHKGGYDANTNTPDLDTSPSGILKGDAYTVSAAGNFFAVAVDAGDVLIADQDNPTVATDWTIVNRNIDESAFAAASHTHAASDVTSGTFADARIAASNVTQHQAALSITESQISDLGSYLTDMSGDTTPQLGGSLDVNGQSIVSASNGDITITPNGTGSIVLDGLNWPQADGTASYYLQTNGAGQLSWAAGGSGLSNVVDDTTPQLGGPLDTNGNAIVSASAGNITITPDTTGSIVLDGLLWPQSDGTSGQLLKTDGAGQLSWVTGGGGASALNDLSDVTITTPTQGHLLRYNGSAWVNENAAIGDLSDVQDSLTGNQGDLLYHNGTHWTALASSGASDGHVLTSDGASGIAWEAVAGGGASALNDLSDVTITAAASGEVLRYNGSAWVDAALTTADIQSGTFADARIAASNVTQHQGSLSITESQISDLGSYLTDITGQSIGSLSDVTLAGTAGGDLLYYTGTEWGNLAAGATDGHVLTADGVGGIAWEAAAGGGDTLPILDSTAVVKDPADNTKLVRIDAGAIGTATTRVITMGDRDVNLASGGTFAELSHTHATTDITSGTFADARIASTNVTQHQGSLTITESQISDLGSYLTDITGQSLGSLSDVTIATVASGEILKWNGSAWINNTLAEAGIAAASHTHTASQVTDFSTAADARIAAAVLGSLSDVTITAIASGEILKWNGSAWINNTLAEAGIAAASHTHTESDITDLKSYLLNVVEDTTPQLGGSLDVNGQSIVSVSNGNITLAPNGTGVVEIVSTLKVAALKQGTASATVLTLAGVTSGTGVNYVTVTSVNDAASGPSLEVAGSGTNTNLNLYTKGTGEVVIQTVAGASALNLKSNTAAKLYNSGTAELQIGESGDTVNIGGRIYQALTTETDGATVTLNWSTGNQGIVTLAGNRTLAFSNLKKGQRYTLWIKQDATGSRTLSYPAYMIWDGGTAPTLATTGTHYDCIVFTCLNDTGAAEIVHGALAASDAN